MRLTRQVALNHGCGETVDGRLMPKSFVRIARQEGLMKQAAGKKAIAAHPAKSRKSTFAPQPSENRGGYINKIRPRRATTTPSHHFWVAPPRKQARIGKVAARIPAPLPKAPARLRGAGSF